MLKAELTEKYRDLILNQGYASFDCEHIQEFKAGTNSKFVDLCNRNGQRVVRKICFSEGMYSREVFAYQKLADCKYIPDLILADRDTLTIITEYKGKSPHDMFKKNSERDQYLPQVKTAYWDMFRNFGMHHNDMKWKNVVIEDDVAYFVDLTRASPNLNDQDTQGILDNIGISDMMKSNRISLKGLL